MRQRSAGRGHDVIRLLAWPAHGNRRGNPYNHLLATALADNGVDVDEFSLRGAIRAGPDVIHVHWPEWLLDAPRSRWRGGRVLGFLAVLVVARWRGAVVVWTVHNLGGHEQTGGLVHRQAARGRAWNMFLRCVDGVISLTESALPEIRRTMPRLGSTPTAVIRHGHYAGEYPDDASRESARADLGLPERARVLLAFGHVRPYKGTVELVTVFRQLDDPDAHLVVAGRPLDDAIAAAVEAAAGGDPRIHLRLGFVDRAQVAPVHRAADLCVLPYLESLNSGAGLLALSFGRPLLAPGQGAFQELQDLVGPQWVRTYDGRLDAATIDRSLHPLDSGEPGPDLSPFDWDGIGKETAAFYRAVRGGS